ncbi:MAG: HNH endonuclease [Planctomycetes bacterium]|nr:HNH endonuclease [Planctomycetota bacterium]
MPYKPATFKLNRGPTCSTLKRNSKASRLRGSGKYKRFRVWFRKRHPMCCDPFRDHVSKGQGAATAQLHHIESVEQRPDLVCVENNAAALCTRCHGKVTAMERRGERTSHLFNPPKIKPPAVVVT